MDSMDVGCVWIVVGNRVVKVTDVVRTADGRWFADSKKVGPIDPSKCFRTESSARKSLARRLRRRVMGLETQLKQARVHLRKVESGVARATER